jgi:ApeA N-terminal domain 1
LTNIGRIAGIIEEDGYITLEGCRYKEKNRNLSGGVSKKSLVYVYKAFIGVVYEEGEDIFFSSFSFSVEGIDEWMGKRSVKVQERGEFENIIITYSRPEEVSINLKNGMRLLIKFHSSFSGGSSTTEFKINQKACFELLSTTE